MKNKVQWLFFNLEYYLKDKWKLSPDVVCRYIALTADLEIRVAALEDIVSDQSTSIQSLQETDVEFEQRVEDLEDYIISELLLRVNKVPGR